ncbi:MAG TPA: hypothetical protein PLZ42_01395 [Methanothrix sp.]|nr:hypothetical protein [Methanothrix sp.]
MSRLKSKPLEFVDALDGENAKKVGPLRIYPPPHISKILILFFPIKGVFKLVCPIGVNKEILRCIF